MTIEQKINEKLTLKKVGKGTYKLLPLPPPNLEVDFTFLKCLFFKFDLFPKEMFSLLSFPCKKKEKKKETFNIPKS